MERSCLAPAGGPRSPRAPTQTPSSVPCSLQAKDTAGCCFWGCFRAGFGDVFADKWLLWFPRSALWPSLRMSQEISGASL